MYFDTTNIEGKMRILATLYLYYYRSGRFRLFCQIIVYLLIALVVIRYLILLVGNLLFLVDSLFFFRILPGNDGLAPYVVSQMDRGEPEPAPAPSEPSEPANAGPSSSVSANPAPLLPDEDRMGELRHRLLINSLGRNWTPEEEEAILETQFEIEKLVEKALLSDGHPPDRLLAKRHQIRAFLFYPKGTALSERTYYDNLSSIGNVGTHRSTPYRKVMAAVLKGDLDLPLSYKKGR